VIVDEPVRGSFAYLEQPGLFAMPAVEQLRLFIERRLPAPPLTHLSGLVVDEASEGASTWSIPASPWWQTAAGVFAGGTLAFVADAALAGAVFTTLPTGTQLLSSDLSLPTEATCSLGRPLSSGSGRSRSRRLGSRTPTAGSWRWPREAR